MTGKTRGGRMHGWMGLLLLAGLSGCATSGPSGMWQYPHARMATTGETPEEHYHRIRRTLIHQNRTLADDLDLLFMTEYETRLTRWHAR